MPEHTHAHQFPSTCWTMVARSGGVDDSTRQKALGELCNLYWPPVYAFIRSKGNSPHDAEDLTQGFFAQLLARDDFAHTDASKGKLRSFLLAGVKNFMTNEWRKATRQKRGGGKVIESLDRDAAENRCRPPEAVDDLSPDKIYERQWGMTLLVNVLAKLRERYEADGKGVLFEAVKAALTPGAPMAPYAEIADRLGISESAFKVAVHRIRQRYACLLRETVADTLGPGEDADEELRQLMAAFM